MADGSQAIIYVYYFNSNEFPNILRQFRCFVNTSWFVEDLLRICADELNISAHSFPFFGLQLQTNNEDKYWLPPNCTIASQINFIQRGTLYFRFRFKPVRSLSRVGLQQQKVPSKHFGFRALLTQSLVLQDQLWYLLLGQCENELEKETMRLLSSKEGIRGGLWALLILARSDDTLKRQRWSKKDIVANAPYSLAKNERFIRDVKGCIAEAMSKFREKDRYNIWITFLEEYVYENASRLIDKHMATYVSSGLGAVFIDTQTCNCYPSVKFQYTQSDVTQEVCTLKEINSFSILGNTIKLMLKKQGQAASFTFRNNAELLSFASELDAQYRSVLDWYANLCCDNPRATFSPRVDMLKSNCILPPSGLSDNLPGIRISDDVPSSILSFRPFILQQSSQKVGWLKVTFSRHVQEQLGIRWQLRFFCSVPDNLWAVRDLNGNEDFERSDLAQTNFVSLNNACQALLDELIRRRVSLNFRNWEPDSNVMVRLAHIGRLPRIHFVDPELVEESKMEGNLQGLPVLAISTQVIRLGHVADGEKSRLFFAAWNGMQFLRRDYNGMPGRLLSCFWKAAENSALWSHFGLASAVAFCPAADFYLLDFAQSPVDSYLLHFCSSAVYLSHLLMAMKTIGEALEYLSSNGFSHGDVRLANVVLFSHTVEPTAKFDVKLIPPSISSSDASDIPHNQAVFFPTDGSPKSDIYAFGVTMIQLLRLGHVPLASDIAMLREDIPSLPDFLDRFPQSDANEYGGPVSKLCNVIKRCLTPRDINSETPVRQSETEFLSSCVSDLDEILKWVHTLWPFPLNPDCNLSSVSGVNRFFHIPSREIVPVIIGDEQPSRDSGFIVLNRGNSGEVLRGMWRCPMAGSTTVRNSLVALKRLLHERPDDSHLLAVDRLKHEFEIWSQLQHKHIIEVFGLTWISERPCIVMECVENGLTLERYCNNRPRGLPFFKEMHSLLLQVISGMRYLSERNQPIVHCDLAARNVLISPQSNGDPIAKIADFGLACIVDPTSVYYQLSRSERMPVAWSAPEIFDCRATPASDVWSFGVMSWEVLCQTDPRSVIRRRPGPDVAEDAPLRFVSDVPGSVVRIISRCWRRRPEERPTFQELEIRLGEIHKNEFTAHCADSSSS